MSEHRRQLNREQALYRYDRALSEGDMATVAAVLAEAEHDAELAQMIVALNNAYAGDPDPASARAQPVRFSANGHRRSKWLSPAHSEQRRTRGLLLRVWSVGLAVLMIVVFVRLILVEGILSGSPQATPVAPAMTTAATPTGEITSTPFPTALPPTPQPLTLETPGSVEVFPGPLHYVGDRLTLVVPLEAYADTQEGSVTLRVDDGDPLDVTAEWQGRTLLVPLDTTGLGAGEHNLQIQAQGGGVQLEKEITLDLLPVTLRPQQEVGTTWQTRTLPCCTLHYISQTAAERDINQIAQHVQAAADAFAAENGVEVVDASDIYFIDRFWANGGFVSNSETIISYVDRNYGPAQGMEGIEVLARNGFAHATGLVPAFFRYEEGLAVYLAGGHYQYEDLTRSAAALFEGGYFQDVTGATSQPETRVLQQAALMEYLANTYGRDALWQYAQADSGQPVSTIEQTDIAMRQVFGLGLDEIEADFKAWLQIQDPGEQVQALQLNVQLQDLRRQYQATYVPTPDYLLGIADQSYGRDDAIPALIREPVQPANVAVELIIANAQQAILDGRYAEAGQLITTLEDVLASGSLTQPLAADYGSIVQVLSDSGYEVLTLEIAAAQALATVTNSPPARQQVTLHRVDGVWRLDG